MTAERRALGQAGEDRAAAWYVERGHEVLDRNWRCRDGELDLVTRLGRTVVFCEVKTRSTDAFGVPAEAVGRAKQLRLRRLALQWLAARGPATGVGAAAELRFDVASVIGDAVEVYESAF